MRRNGTLERNINDVPCGQELTDAFVRNFHRETYKHHNKLSSRTKKQIDEFIEICRNVIHIRYVDLHRFDYNHEQNNLELRIKYLRNYISENEFRRTLQINEKRNQKKREINNPLLFLSCH